MSGVNKVILVGNLGKDPEIRYTETNVARLSFTLATTEIHKDKNGNRAEHTEWHNIVMWRQMAQNAEKLLRKGMQVYIEGRLQTRQWADKEGQKKSITEINADHFVLLQKRETEKPAHSEGDTPIDHNPPY